MSRTVRTSLHVCPAITNVCAVISVSGMTGSATEWKIAQEEMTKSGVQVRLGN